MIQFDLPWPSKDLSPNARLHWAKKAKAVRQARSEAEIIAKGYCRPLEGRILFVLEFFPPDRRRYDDDGLLARMKSARDGIADALGVDDRRFVTQFSVSDTVVKGGKVSVTISEATK
jgi:Holliday junction resolvase RusA-like endonuclease